MNASELQRFRAKVSPVADANGCLVWIGSKSSNGYGNMRLSGAPVRTASRTSTSSARSQRGWSSITCAETGRA